MDAVHMEHAMALPPAVKSRRPPARSTYRHGDLRRALLDAGVELARSGGPDAVVLREATRRAGVVPNAAYRHFSGREDLLEAVRAAALAALAVAMEEELGRLQRGRDDAEFARASLRAVGAGYLKFAMAQTGLFRTAFSVPAAPDDGDSDKTGSSGLNPFQLLSAALDKMVAAAALPPERRQGAEFLAWSAVHGFAVLLIEGPLKGIPAKQAAGLGQRLLDMVEKGL
jgi:AcrR family transcriptional regulator